MSKLLLSRIRGIYENFNLRKQDFHIYIILLHIVVSRKPISQNTDQ